MLTMIVDLWLSTLWCHAGESPCLSSSVQCVPICVRNHGHHNTPAGYMTHEYSWCTCVSHTILCLVWMSHDINSWSAWPPAMRVLIICIRWASLGKSNAWSDWSCEHHVNVMWVSCDSKGVPGSVSIPSRKGQTLDSNLSLPVSALSGYQR